MNSHFHSSLPLGRLQPLIQESTAAKSSTADERTISFKLLPHSKTDEEIKRDASNEFSAILMTMKRDVEVVAAHHIDKLMKLKEKLSTKHSRGRIYALQELDYRSFSQLLSNPDVLKHIDEAIAAVMKWKEAIHDIPDPPSFHPGIDGLDHKLVDDALPPPICEQTPPPPPLPSLDVEAQRLPIQQPRRSTRRYVRKRKFGS